MQNWSGLITKINISPAQLSIEMDASALSKHLNLPTERLAPEVLTITSPFQLRRRGVETKLVLGNAPPEVDLPLIRNIVKAMEWYDAIKSGKSFAQIATQAGVKTDRVRSVMNLAFLAPNIIEQVISGTLPLHMTSDFLIRTGVPSDWNAQREMLKTVGTRSVR